MPTGVRDVTGEGWNDDTGHRARSVVPVDQNLVPQPSGAAANQASAAGALQDLPIAKYNATQPTVTDGRYNELQIDANGNLRTVDAAVEVGSFFDAIANDVDISVKGSAGYLMAVTVNNINASARFLQFHNKATAPTGGDTPVFSKRIPGGSANAPGDLELNETFFGRGGRPFTTGISIGISTTESTFTAATTTDHEISGRFV